MLTFYDRNALVAWVDEQLAEDPELRQLVATIIADALAATFPTTIDPVLLDDTIRSGLRSILAEWAAFSPHDDP